LNRDWIKPSISPSWKCLDILGIIRIVAEGLAQLRYRHPEAVIEVLNRIVRPNSIANLLASYDFPGVFQQRQEYPKRLLLQSHYFMVLSQFSCTD
jgi:hypothetical protein